MQDSGNIRIAGLGGMGVLTATLVLGEVLFQEGYDVKKAEVHGMAQRGGSVSSDVRYGKTVKSPMIPAGQVDALISLEPEWSDAHLPDLRPGGILISPSTIDAAKLPSAKSLNIALLGALSLRLPQIPLSRWTEVLQKTFPQKLHSANEAAFKLGREALAA
jgi:indolepyruvate ferredoxin oxidoreductase beta subunit